VDQLVSVAKRPASLSFNKLSTLVCAEPKTLYFMEVTLRGQRPIGLEHSPVEQTGQALMAFSTLVAQS
jgi:hypothetical protein